MDRPLCCFIDPEYSVDPRRPDDVCPVCEREYGFPVSRAPKQIREFTVVKPLGRGFYAAAYLVTSGSLGVESVLKVAPKAIYEKFADYGKDFVQESRLHRQVAENSSHLVPIRDMFEADVIFGDVTLPCWVAELDYVKGEELDELLIANPPPSARTVAQIALDLLQLLEELQGAETFHNDLHGGNVMVERLPPTARRAEALDDSVRAVAIDLGSLTEGSKSDLKRLGDLHSVAAHLETFATRLLQRPGETADLDYRLAGQLQEIAGLLSSEAVNQRPPEFAVLRERLRHAHDFVASPWKEPPPLRSIDDSYNAQTLHPWFVPKLLVDPDSRWREAISIQGPQVITGMRGCGKTMLLRSVMFHSRASAHPEQTGGEALREALIADHYVGFYVSCNRLLDPLGSTNHLHRPESRLFVAYVREALRALRHLRELDSSFPAPGAARRIGEVVANYISGTSGPDVDTDDELGLERLTLRMLASLQRGESTFELQTDPAAAFVALAEAVQSASPIWAGSAIFYLLDDVSTRHLDAGSIQELVSRLIFSNEICAFKMTTEAQTLEYVLKSPGLVERAMPNRDYNVFQFGAAVNERIRAPIRDGGGTRFIRDILELRAAQYPAHPTGVSPADFLGDAQLETIAQAIATLPATAAERKRIYHGIRALTAVCVGDIGDVLAIYDSMFRRAGGDRVPIPAEIQHQSFLDYCAKRLYHLNHRAGRFKDVALGFAQAARDLLVASADKDRLRQYSSVYVRVTTGDDEAQFERLRTLIDAGVFVLDGGAARTKTRDDDPVQQFSLRYRKLFGLASYIGLSDRDRFELSGDDLRDWLDDPKRGKEILMRNLGGDLPQDPQDDAPLEAAEDDGQSRTEDGHLRPITLFESFDVPSDETTEEEATRRQGYATARTPVCTELRAAEMSNGVEVQSVVAGLGFEDRTLESTIRLSSLVRPASALLVGYEFPGHAERIRDAIASVTADVVSAPYRSWRGSVDHQPPPGPCLIDVTGLAKPLIFQLVRRALRRDGRVLIAHTQAETHYPLDADIERVLEASRSDDIWESLDAVDDVWPGEAGPYEFEQLLQSDADESRRRFLLASASPKHQRLLSLVQEREFDRIQVLAPSGSSARAELARRAADVVTRLADDSGIEELASDDLAGALAAISSAHQTLYVDGNYNFELGLTGSKLHAVAFAAATAAMRVSQAWYVRPQEFDPGRFSIGVGDTRFFELSLRE